MGIKNPNFNKTPSKETIKKLRQKMLGNKNPNYGRKHTSEELRKMSDANKGISKSEETKKKISISMSGNKGPLYNHTIYTFKNINTLDIFIGTCFNFRMKHNLSAQEICHLLHKRRKHIRGWIIHNHDQSI